jgi:DNA-directed RNA polymerase specialized sigma24 family protein
MPGLHASDPAKRRFRDFQEFAEATRDEAVVAATRALFGRPHVTERDRDDIVHQVYWEILNKWEGTNARKTEARLRSCLFKRIKWRTIDLMREREREIPTAADDLTWFELTEPSDVENDYLRRELIEHVRRYLMSLPEPDRSIMLSDKDDIETLGISRRKALTIFNRRVKELKDLRVAWLEGWS